MAPELRQLQAPLAALPPAYRPWLLHLLQAALPLLLRWRLLAWLPAGIRHCRLEGGERLLALIAQFQQGNCRLLLAFRHSDVDDPLCGLWLFGRGLPRLARQRGIRLRRPLHVHFLYDRGMPLWGGRPLGWLLAGLGGVALRRGRRPDWGALRQARRLMLEGAFPLALAPEGATNGHGECLGPLQPGAAQLALWCCDDLRRAGRRQAVWIVPIGIRYSYPGRPWRRLDRLLGQLERQLALGPHQPLPPVPPALQAAPADLQRRYRRLLRLGLTLLEELEGFYGRFYPAVPMAARSTPGLAAPEDGHGADGNGVDGSGEDSARTHPAASLEQRLADLLDRALQVAERHFGLEASGTLADRCRRLEEAGWQWIYREDLPPRRQLSPLQRSLADRVAHEASLALVHMRLVESFVAVSGHYVAEQPSFERFAETCLLLHDALARLRGSGLPARPTLGWRVAELRVLEPIRVDTWLADQQDQRQRGLPQEDSRKAGPRPADPRQPDPPQAGPGPGGAQQKSPPPQRARHERARQANPRQAASTALTALLRQRLEQGLGDSAQQGAN